VNTHQKTTSATLVLLTSVIVLPGGYACAQTGHFVPGPSAAFGQAFEQDFPPLNPTTGYAIDPLITFPLTVLPAREGTIEFWARLSGSSDSSDINFVGST